MSNVEPRMTARELVGNPMDGLPSDLAEAMAPYLKMASTSGSRWADSCVLQRPLPWSEEHGERVSASMVEAFDDLIRRELEGLTDPVFGAMHRQCFIAFSDRMDALMSGFKAVEGSGPQ